MPETQPAQIFWIDLGEIPDQVVGHEQAKTRPCLVIQSQDFMALAVILPITSKRHQQFQHTTVKLTAGTGGLKEDSYVLCHQIRTVSYERVRGKIGILPPRDFEKVKVTLKDFLEL